MNVARLLVLLSVGLALASPASAAVCPDMGAPSIVAPAAAAGAKCLAAVTKAGAKYVKAVLKADAKCVGGQDPLACPDAKGEAKKQKAASKGAEKIAKACADDAAQAALASAYGSISDETQIGSCVLSQHQATLKVMSGTSNGAPVPFPGSKDRDKCAAALGNAAAKMAPGIYKTITKCVDKRVKDGDTSDLGPACVGSWSGGAYTPPTDTKTADKITKALAKAEADIDKRCGALSTAVIETIFACPGASTVDDLKNCIVCENWAGLLELLDQAYNENGTFVANGPGALQSAIDAAAVGEKLLIEPGDYAEEVVISTDGLQLVGCGGATDERPRVLPPAGPGPFPNGIFAANVNGLVFQSIEVFDWEENGIFVTGANGVTFRDVVGDGNVKSTYAIFPVQSDSVVVEGSYVTGVTDAGIYVGQDTNIVIRYNLVELNVAGIEVENSAFADVHNNVARHNTGGILVFKLPGPPVQLSNDHDVHHNVSVQNNTPNFGDPNSTVGLIPDGTGMFVISNDTSLFHHNYMANNNSFGFVLIDQQGINALVGAPVFDPTSPDQKTEDNDIYLNVLISNGTSPDSTPPNNTPIGGDIVFFLGEDANHSNCFGGLGINQAFDVKLLTANDCS